MFLWYSYSIFVCEGKLPHLMVNVITFITAEVRHCSRLQIATNRKEQHGEWFLVCSSKCSELCDLEYLSSITQKYICAALEFADALRESEGQNQQTVV